MTRRDTDDRKAIEGTANTEDASEHRATSMRAIVQRRYGTPEVLEMRTVDVPEPGDDQVLIEVAASSVNAYDWHMTTGTPYMARATAGLIRPSHPIPGADVAGIVRAVGSEVSRFQPGDEVFGEIGSGALAEYAVAGERHLARKPKNVTFEQAAATPMAGLTALQGLRDHGGVGEGSRVVVNGASGGVGTFAVQIAKALGAQVTAVCSTGKVEMARSLGADHVIDYTNANYTELVRDHDVLFDNAGTRPWRETKKVLAPDGIVVTITGPMHAWLGPVRNLIARKMASSLDSRRMAWFTAAVRPDDLEELGRMLESGAIEPFIEAVHSLEEFPEALAHLGEGHTRGKIAITI